MAKASSALLFDKVALITGASRGVGYAAARKLCEKFPGGTIYLATKNQKITPELNKKMRDDFPEANERCEYVHLDIRDPSCVEKVRDMIKERHDNLDILINNAGRYEVPDMSTTDKFADQADLILGTNYWGLKNVMSAMKEILIPGARIVNTSSHLGHLSLINGEAKKSLHLREQLANPNIEENKLDKLMEEFQSFARSGDWQAEGWPNCAYTVSKVGVNVYTRLLQRQFDEEGNNIVVNSIHPGTTHSKIQQQSVIPLEDGAFAIANCACVPEKGLKGQVLWHNLTPIVWEEAVTRPSLLNSAAFKVN